jgi:hypothetical protein
LDHTSQTNYKSRLESHAKHILNTPCQRNCFTQMNSLGSQTNHKSSLAKKWMLEVYKLNFYFLSYSFSFYLFFFFFFLIEGYGSWPIPAPPLPQNSSITNRFVQARLRLHVLYPNSIQKTMISKRNSKRATMPTSILARALLNFFFRINYGSSKNLKLHKITIKVEIINSHLLYPLT